MIVYKTDWGVCEYSAFFTNKAEAIRFARQCAHDEPGGDASVARLDIGKINAQKIITILNHTSPAYLPWTSGYVSRRDIVWESK